MTPICCRCPPVHRKADALNLLARLVALRIAIDLEPKSGAADVPSEPEFAEPDFAVNEVPVGSTGISAELRPCTWHGLEKKSRLPGIIPLGAVLKLHPVSTGALTTALCSTLNSDLASVAHRKPTSASCWWGGSPSTSMGGHPVLSKAL